MAWLGLKLGFLNAVARVPVATGTAIFGVIVLVSP